MNNDAPFHTFESSDPAFLVSYVELRKRVFRLHYEGLAEDFGEADDTDLASRIVYVFQGDRLAGAARLTVSTPENPCVLPLEDCGFRLRGYDALCDFELGRRPYGEISRMAVDPACSQGLAASLCLAAGLCRVASALSVDTLFSICPPGAVRLNRRNAAALGVMFRKFRNISTAYGREMSLCAFAGIVQVGTNLSCAFAA